MGFGVDVGGDATLYGFHAADRCGFKVLGVRDIAAIAIHDP